jgi:hypothetical protein
MTARQRKQQAKPLKRRRGDTTPTDPIHPEPPVFVPPAEVMALIMPPEPLVEVPTSAFAIMKGLKGEL